MNEKLPSEEVLKQLFGGEVPEDVKLMVGDGTKTLKARVDAVMGTMTPDEEKVFKLRYGIDGSPALDHQSVADQIGKTVDDVQILERSAFDKIIAGGQKEGLLPDLGSEEEEQ